MQKLVTNKLYEGSSSKIITFTMTKFQTLFAAITVGILLVASISNVASSIWGAGGLQGQVRELSYTVQVNARDISELKERMGPLYEIQSTVRDLNEGVKDLKEEIGQFRSDWKDLWKNYNIPRKSR